MIIERYWIKNIICRRLTESKSLSGAPWLCSSFWHHHLITFLIAAIHESWTALKCIHTCNLIRTQSYSPDWMFMCEHDLDNINRLLHIKYPDGKIRECAFKSVIFCVTGRFSHWQTTGFSGFSTMYLIDFSHNWQWSDEGGTGQRKGKSVNWWHQGRYCPIWPSSTDHCQSWE